MTRRAFVIFVSIVFATTVSNLAIRKTSDKDHLSVLPESRRLNVSADGVRINGISLGQASSEISTSWDEFDIGFLTAYYSKSGMPNEIYFNEDLVVQGIVGTSLEAGNEVLLSSGDSILECVFKLRTFGDIEEFNENEIRFRLNSSHWLTLLREKKLLRAVSLMPVYELPDSEVYRSLDSPFWRRTNPRAFCQSLVRFKTKAAPEARSPSPSG